MKIDLHVHSCEISPCGKVPAREMMRMYKENGYDLVVLTDHLFPGLNTLPQDGSYAEKAEKWLEGYRTAKDEGDKIGLKVLLGGEARLCSYGSEDFLVFGRETQGLDEDLLSHNYEKCVRIPMKADARSLNLSNSVAIMLYEALRQQDFPSLSGEGHLHHTQPEGPEWKDYV